MKKVHAPEEVLSTQRFRNYESARLNVADCSNTDTSAASTSVQLHSQNKEVLGDSRVNIRLWGWTFLLQLPDLFKRHSKITGRVNELRA